LIIHYRAHSSSAVGGALVFFPWLMEIAPGLTGWSKFTKAVSNLHILIQGHIDNHKLTIQEDHSRDYLDVFLHEIRNTTDPKSSFYGTVGCKTIFR